MGWMQESHRLRMMGIGPASGIKQNQFQIFLNIKDPKGKRYSLRQC